MILNMATVHLKTKALCEADFLKDRILIKGWLDFKNGQKKIIVWAEYLANQAFLQDCVIWELFGAFLKEISGLKENVREEFLKHEIAYKAETKFVGYMKNGDKSFIQAKIADKEIPINMKFHPFSFQTWIMWRGISYSCQFYSKWYEEVAVSWQWECF